MSTYAIGDIQGCQKELISLLNEINFDDNRDQLWFCGDLVNRGPQSLETLRFVKQLEDKAITVLGNHDLHLLAIAHGQSQYLHKSDTLDEILKAEDRAELFTWLRQLPLIHQDDDLGYTLVHAGLPPQWSIEQALNYAREVEIVLASSDHVEYFANMYGNSPDTWSEDLQGWERLRAITNYFTRLRYCDRKGKMEFSEKNKPGKQPLHYQPWFELENRLSLNHKILFGHWAALRTYNIDYSLYNVFPLDTGCLWGGDLSALRLEDETWFTVPSTQKKWSK